MKKARTSIFSKMFGDGEDYDCQQPWPEDCFVQAGEKGIVFTPKGTYETSFFEAFPKYPETFIRGEGKTIKEAEEKAWKKYKKYLDCPKHEYERRSYRNGAGFCKHCNMFASNVFEPLTRCVKCDIPTFWSSDKNDNFYCKEHADLNPDRKSYEL